jgi:hypothetical protein
MEIQVLVLVRAVVLILKKIGSHGGKLNCLLQHSLSKLRQYLEKMKFMQDQITTRFLLETILIGITIKLVKMENSLVEVRQFNVT